MPDLNSKEENKLFSVTKERTNFYAISMVQCVPLVSTWNFSFLRDITVPHLLDSSFWIVVVFQFHICGNFIS